MTALGTVGPVSTGSKTVGVASNRGNTLSIEVDTFEVERLYGAIEAAVSGSSLRRFLEGDATKYFDEQISMRFLHQGDEKSGAWAPLQDATQDIRKAMGVRPDGPINIRTALTGNRDSLFDFMTGQYDVREEGQAAELDVPGNGDPVQMQKLKTAQQGSLTNPLGYRPTPPRPVLADATDTDLQELMMKLQGFIMLEVAGALV